MELAGNLFLWIGVVAAGLSAAAGIVTVGMGQEGRTRRLELSVSAMRLSALSALAAVGVLAAGFFVDDFRIRAVQVASSRHLSVWFKASLLWVDLETSMLFWTFVLAGVSALALSRFVQAKRDGDQGNGDGRRARLAGGAAAVMGLLVGLFLAVVLVRYDPFDTYLVERPLYGAGMKPMLRNFWMLIHPPVQYLGYGLALVPFSLTTSALLTKTPLDRAFFRILHPWVLASWLALAAGMVLGMIWAYGEVDWGGYWNWDPVENAALMPFVMSTVAVHSVLLARRGRAARGWAVISVFATFWLTVLGAFLTRTGAVDSVHSFGKDSFLLTILGAVLILGLAFSGLVLWGGRGAWLSVDHAPIESSKKRGYLDFRNLLSLSNWLLSAALVVVLVGSVGPMLWKVFAGRTIKVDRSFYETWLLPVGPLSGLFVGFAYGLMAPARFRGGAWLRWVPGLLGGFAGALVVIRVAGASWWALATGAAAGFALGEAGFASVMALLATKRFRSAAGGLIHVGLALVLMGLAGRAGLVRAQGKIPTGGRMKVAGQVFEYLGPQVKDTLEADVVETLVETRGRVVKTGLVAYLASPDMPVGKTKTLRSLWRDIQLRSLAVSATGDATFQVVIHPLVSWMWAGFALMVMVGLGLVVRRPTVPSSRTWMSLGGWMVLAGAMGVSMWISRGSSAGWKVVAAAVAVGAAGPVIVEISTFVSWVVSGVSKSPVSSLSEEGG